MASPTIESTIFFVILLVFFCVYCLFIIRQNDTKSIATCHVINLDKDAERMRHIQAQASLANITVQRFPAVYGKDLSVDEMWKHGVGYIMSKSGIGSYKEQLKERRNLGAIGCFISHKTLLQKLAKMPVPDNHGHLILEDDVQIPRNLIQDWENLSTAVPSDWDIVYFGMNNPKGYHIHPKIMRLQDTGKDNGNWGTHAYLVRHGSIRALLKKLEYMFDSIDVQYSRFFNEMSVYIVPKLVPLNMEQAKNSTIQNM